MLVKIKAVGRTLKEFKNYKQEVESFDPTLVAQDKKQAEFFNESQSAMENVKKNLVEFALQYEAWIVNFISSLGLKQIGNIRK